MSEQLRCDEVAIRRDLFNGLVDELTDALGWLLVIQEENPGALQKACGQLNAEERLAQMSAILSGRTFDKRYAIKDCTYSINEDGEETEDSTEQKAEDSNSRTDLETWKRAVEEKKDEDSRNTRN